MARENRASVPAAISNQEILAEINLISQIQQIETRLATEPDSIRFAQLADAYLGIGDFDHAITLCEKGLKLHPQYDTGTLVLAKSYYLSGNKIRAREVLQDFLVSNPASLAGHKLLGDLSLEEDDVTETVTHYRIALRFDPINRQIIQTLVDLKDKYQKIKESKTSEEEEEPEIKPAVIKVVPKTVAAEKPIEKSRPVSEEKPVVKVEPVREISKLDSFIEEAIQPEDDKIEFKPAEMKSVKSEPVITKPEEKPKVELPKGEFSPAYTDENGIMYFYDDDEVSFDQYKKRLDLQKAGKALILERVLLDQKLIEKGVKSAAQAQPKEEDIFKQTESAFDLDSTKKEFEFETAPPKAEIKPQKDEAKQFTSFEDHIDQSMAKEEEELLSAAEQEAALSEIEISYKDYLDILTNEDDLLEALFQEEHEASMDDEKEDKAGNILRSTFSNEDSAAIDKETTDRPIAYLDYVQSLENESDIEEATFTKAPLKDDGGPVSFSEFSSYLDQSGDTIDFNTYALLLTAEGVSPDSLWDVASAIEEPVLKYQEYISTASDSEKAEAQLETKKAEEVKDSAQEQPVSKFAIEELTAEIKLTEPPATKTGFINLKEEPKPAEQPQIKEEVEETADESEEEYIEEEINPQDATPELVEKLASRGQFGTAYKVCKMLKVKNPTDAKVDRKILELKRLYVWSSQMVG